MFFMPAGNFFGLPESAYRKQCTAVFAVISACMDFFCRLCSAVIKNETNRLIYSSKRVNIFTFAKSF